MIKELRLQNFQAHKDTVLEFHPGVNVIAGSSNSGKSSILRAINWLLYNRPSGDAFVSHWARDEKKNQKEDTSVEIVTETHAVERRKSKTTKNTYTLNELVLEAVGLDVPDAVKSSLNMGDVNTQRQHDAPFLLSESPGEVARFFNKIVHFDAIDEYLSRIESKKRKTKADGANAKENAERLEADLTKFDWIERAEKLCDAVEAREDLALERRERVDVLQSDIRTYLAAESALTLAQDALDQSQVIIGKIEQCLQNLGIAEDKSKRLGAEIRTFNDMSATIEAAKDVEYAEKLCRKIERKQELQRDMAEQLQSLKDSIVAYGAAQEALSAAGAELEQIKLPDVCPLCGRGSE